MCRLFLLLLETRFNSEMNAISIQRKFIRVISDQIFCETPSRKSTSFSSKNSIFYLVLFSPTDSAQ